MAYKKAPASVSKPDDDYLRILKRKFALSQDLCEQARRDAETDQDYYDGKQWTSDEISILKGRRQPALVFNEVKPGINGMIGIVERGKTDPQALGREQGDSDGAEVITDCLRYVADKNRFQNLRSQGLKDFFIPGIVSCIVEIEGDDREIKYTKGRYEAFFYDPSSREPDFSDARWLGLANWMDEDDALTLPWCDSDDKKKYITTSVEISDIGGSPTTEDRPKDGAAWSWGDKVKRRVMVVQMWHRKGPVWHMCVFVSAGFLHQGESEYKDDKGRPTCNLIAQSAYVDRENKRYGPVRDMRGPQDAMNKGWSKAVHILNVAKLRVDPGVKDVDEVRKEWARPDGVIEAREGQIEEIGDKLLLPAHMEMLQLAEQKMRRQTPTPGIVGRNASSQSGKAILAEQQAGMTEQAPTLGSFDDWTLRIYRMTGACIKQFWTAPKYIRVTGDENAPRYVLINKPEPVVDAKGQPVIDPKTGQQKIRFVKPAEMDFDIIIDSTPDTASLQQDQYQKLLELETVLAQTGSTDRIPTKAIIAASSLPKKRDIIDAMDQAKEEAAKQPQQPGPAEIEQQKQQITLQANQAKHEQDSQAHMAELQRTDEADRMKAERQAALAEQGFRLKEREAMMQHNLAQQSANSQAARDQQKMRAEAKAKPKANGEAKGEGAQGELPLEDDMNISLPPELAQALTEHMMQTREAATQRAAQAQEASAQASAAVPQAMVQVAQAILQSAQATERAAAAMERAAVIQASPKMLKIVDGVKMAVPLLTQAPTLETMQ